MALLVSSWSNGVQSMPKDYIMPPDRRPEDFLTVCKDIPVIDLEEKQGTDRSDIVQQILRACQEFGLFQVINHGVPEKMMEDMRILYKEFFDMPVEDKSEFYKNGSGKGCKLYTSGLNYSEEEAHYWKDTLSHPCHPLEEQMPSWPNKPARYREEVGRYTIEMRKIGLRILDLIGEGLGLKEEYFGGVMSHEHGMAINHYPPCPDPSLAMGIGGHTDPNLITFLQQDQFGLQIHKDGQWLGVEAIPNAFVVNLGYQLQIISNGKLKSVEHRGVTNSNAARTSIVTFFGPDRSMIIEPAKELVTSDSPQKFKAYEYKEFIENYLAYLKNPMPRTGTPLDPYMLWAHDIESLPVNYIMPPDKRPSDVHTICKEIPVIDLRESSSHHPSDLAHQILKASQEFGIFQVINHGISEEMMKDAMDLYKEFFSMSVEDKSKVYCSEFGPNTQVYTSGLTYDSEEIHYWNDTLKHSCYPLEEQIPSWPDKPARYREVIAKYAVEVKKLGYKILDLISEGLGLEQGTIREELRQDHGMGINHYPRCPDPSLAMGIRGHADPNLITLLQQEVYGLQILYDGKWAGVEPIPSAFVVNLGYQMQVISNGKIKSVVHQAVTNSKADRTSIVTFLAPLPHVVVEPAKELVTSTCNPQLYKGFVYKEFLGEFVDFLIKKDPNAGTPLDAYELKAN